MARTEKQWRDTSNGKQDAFSICLGDELTIAITRKDPMRPNDWVVDCFPLAFKRVPFCGITNDPEAAQEAARMLILAQIERFNRLAFHTA